MAKTPQEAIQSMIANMSEKTGKSLEQWFTLIKKQGLSNHTEILKLLRDKHKVTYGFANMIALLYRQQASGGPSSDDDLVAAQLAGPKAAMKPLYNLVIKAVKALGKDVVLSPKKAYVSLRRNQQFGLVQFSTKDRIDLGLILKGVPKGGRLEDGAAWNGMCTHRVRLGSSKDLDKEILGWLKQAYEQG